MARNAYGYVQAYVPLFIAFVILFAGVWAYTSFGPHTPTAKDNWTRIESIWKPKRDADLKAVSVAVANNDFNALLSAYKSLGADTRGWMDDLNNIASWDDPNATPNPNAAATTTELVQQLTGDGTAEADLLQNQMGAAKSMDDLLALRDDLNADDTALQSDFLAAETAIPASRRCRVGNPWSPCRPEAWPHPRRPGRRAARERPRRRVPRRPPPRLRRRPRAAPAPRRPRPRPADRRRPRPVETRTGTGGRRDRYLSCRHGRYRWR